MYTGWRTRGSAIAQAKPHTHAPPQLGGNGACGGCQRAAKLRLAAQYGAAAAAAAAYRAPMHGQAGSGA